MLGFTTSTSMFLAVIVSVAVLVFIRDRHHSALDTSISPLINTQIQTREDVFIQTLALKIQQEQVYTDQPYESLLSPQKLRGLYNCDVFMNLNGEPPLGELRNKLHIFDNNMFSSALVTILTLQAHQEGAPRPTDEQVNRFLETLNHFHDKNSPFNNSLVAFWPAEFNESKNYWNHVSVNYLKTFQLLDDVTISAIDVLLQKLGAPPQLTFVLEELRKHKFKTMRATVFVPSDPDCSSMNLVLGSNLYAQREEMPGSWELWQRHNSNLTSVFHALKKYAYRPFSGDPNSNSIDPRSHFYLRGFLDQAKTEGRDVALVTTWFQGIDEVNQEINISMSMHVLVNNVDVALDINVIYGICSGVLSGVVGPEVLDDPDLVKILLNTTSLIAYQLAHNFSDRPDLALLYYPASFNFFMFVAKTVELLHSARVLDENISLKPLESMYQILREAVDLPLTNTILSQVKTQGSDQFYFEEFLGNGDTLMGEPVIKGEDRIFTTAAAANTLMSAWTERSNSSSKKYKWRSGTSDQVKKVVAGCVKWLRQNTLGGQFLPHNAVYSISTKGFESGILRYPANRIEYLNGSTISDFSHVPSSPFLYAYQGYLPADQYASQVNQPHLGGPTPTAFHGFNGPTNVFRLWNSVPYTYATTMLAVAKYNNIS